MSQVLRRAGYHIFLPLLYSIFKLRPLKNLDISNGGGPPLVELKKFFPDFNGLLMMAHRHPPRSGFSTNDDATAEADYSRYHHNDPIQDRAFVSGYHTGYFVAGAVCLTQSDGNFRHVL